MGGPSETLYTRGGALEGKNAMKVLMRFPPRWTRWLSHAAFYTGKGKDLELLDVVPVNWWTGKAKLDFEKLKGHGQTAEDPLLVDFRYKSIFDWVGLGSLDLVIGNMEVVSPAAEEAAAKQAPPEEAEVEVPTPEKAKAEVPLSAKAEAEETVSEEAEAPIPEKAEAEVPTPAKKLKGSQPE